MKKHKHGNVIPRLMTSAVVMLLSFVVRVVACEPECSGMSQSCPLRSVTYTPADSTKVMQLLDAACRQPADTDHVLFFARRLIGTPYVAHTLEINDVERLVVNLRQLDCTTYVETVIALSMCMRSADLTFESYCRNLRTLRYIRDTEPLYTTRLHYFTLWIEDNTLKGLCTEQQQPDPPFTEVQTVSASYMTTHPDRYRMLANNAADIPGIRAQEESITGRTYRYIPQDMIDNSPLLRSVIHDGDVIAIITTIDGLDTQHIGIAVWHDDGLHLLNASSIHKKVVEESMTLRQYLQRHKTMPGIRVLRLTL